jgi:hypothetical protein
VKPREFEPAPSAVQKLIGLFWPVLLRQGISVFCRYFTGLSAALCPPRTSLCRPGCSTFAQAQLVPGSQVLYFSEPSGTVLHWCADVVRASQLNTFW